MTDPRIEKAAREIAEELHRTGFLLNVYDSVPFAAANVRPILARHFADAPIREQAGEGVDQSTGLKPCPHCGLTEPRLHTEPDSEMGDESYVCCDECRTFGPVGDTPKDAIAAWNRRAIPEPGARTFEAWTSVADRLPDEGDEVLAIIPMAMAPPDADPDERFCYEVGRYALHEPGKWTLDGRSDGTKVTHWMPLPEPPVQDRARSVETMKDGAE